MLNTYQYPTYDYVQSDEQRQARVKRHPVVIIGAGPVGLTAAIDLAQNGVPVVVLDDDNTVSQGSRAICFAKRTLDILDRLGTGQCMVDKGVTWNTGKVFCRDQAIYEFNLLSDTGHQRPAFINLQQYYFEAYLIQRLQTLDHADLRWQHKVIAVQPHADQVTLQIETPDGVFAMTCDYLLACDGARSPVRKMLGLSFSGQTFQDRFLIADVVMQGEYPAERWFWFDPPFSSGQSALLHKQPDDVWRIDFQLGWDADPDEESKPEKVIPRLQAMLGDDRPFQLEWVSVYTFSCLRLEQFRHGRVIFSGDSAHLVSPFGARGANGGIQDVDNLVWKLRLVLAQQAPEALLDSYNDERTFACDENILNSTRSTDFITPKNNASRDFRDAVLALAADYAFARALVNSGRLSVPATLHTSPLNTPDEAVFNCALVPGSACVDAPIYKSTQAAWLLDQLGNEFTLLYFADTDAELCFASLNCPISLRVLRVATTASSGHITDPQGLVAQRYDAQPNTCYLIRPDQHVAARWRDIDANKIRAALQRATAQPST